MTRSRDLNRSHTGRVTPAPVASPYPITETLRKAAFAALSATTLSAAALVGLPSTEANAQQTICGARESLVERLEVRFKESETAFGITGNGMVAELFVSAEGSWTLVLTRPDGISCLMAAGQNWEMLPPDMNTAAQETPS